MVNEHSHTQPAGVLGKGTDKNKMENPSIKVRSSFTVKVRDATSFLQFLYLIVKLVD